MNEKNCKNVNVTITPSTHRALWKIKKKTCLTIERLVQVAITEFVEKRRSNKNAKVDIEANI